MTKRNLMPINRSINDDEIIQSNQIVIKNFEKNNNQNNNYHKKDKEEWDEI